MYAAKPRLFGEAGRSDGRSPAYAHICRGSALSSPCCLFGGLRFQARQQFRKLLGQLLRLAVVLGACSVKLIQLALMLRAQIVKLSVQRLHLMLEVGAVGTVDRALNAARVARAGSQFLPQGYLTAREVASQRLDFIGVESVHAT